MTAVPPLHAVFGYTFYIGGFSVGPFFPYQRYARFIDDSLCTASQDSGRVTAFAKRLAAAVAYLALSNALTKAFPDTIMYTEEFQNNFGFAYKWMYITLSMKFMIMRYVSIWLLNEGSSILLGLRYVYAH